MGEVDAYELLGIDEEAGDKEVQAAYRKGSLKCHPDRNPDDPEAGAKFDQLTQAKDTLLNPILRAELDRGRKAKREVAIRNEAEDAKRRKMREDLEAREDASSRRSAAAFKAPTASQNRKKAQESFASRIASREAELVESRAKLAQDLAAHHTQEDLRVRATWREGVRVTLEQIHDHVTGFEVRSVEVNDDFAVLRVSSREEALRLVLHCRERRFQMPFRVSLMDKSKDAAQGPRVSSTSREPSEKKGAASDAVPSGSGFRRLGVCAAR